MHSLRKTFALGLAFTALVFCCMSLYIPASSFHWTIKLGDVEFGLSHMKSDIYFVRGADNPQDGIHVSARVASTIVSLIIGLSSLTLLLLWQYLETKTKVAGHSPKPISQ